MTTQQAKQIIERNFPNTNMDNVEINSVESKDETVYNVKGRFIVTNREFSFEYDTERKVMTY